MKVGSGDLCGPYNSTQGCRNPGHHGSVFHYCMYCLATVDKLCTHSRAKCDRKFREMNGGRSQFSTHQPSNNNNNNGGHAPSSNWRPSADHNKTATAPKNS